VSDELLLDRIKHLEEQLEMIRLDMELIDRRNLKEIKRLVRSVETHRTMLMDLKPVYDEFRVKKLESKREVFRGYG